jgi:hypothetical protein
MRLLRLFLCLSCLLILFLPSVAAHAKGSSKATAKAAKKACAAGDFRKGVVILAELYVESNDTVYIFNQGRCYEQNHQWMSAIDRFREYLRNTPNISPEDKDAAERHVAECQRYQGEGTLGTVATSYAPVTQSKEPAVAPVAASPEGPPPPPPATGPGVPSPDFIRTPTSTAEEGRASSNGSGLRTVGAIAAGLGIATLATAIVLNVKANDLAHQANSNYDSAATSSQKSYRTGAIACYLAGGLTLLAGSVLYLVGYGQGSSAKSGVVVLPILTSSSAGLLMQGNY